MIFQAFYHLLAKETIKTSADMSGMFSWLSYLTEIVFGNLDTSAATNMSSLFDNCRSLSSLDLTSFNTSNVTNMKSMFRLCEKIKTIYVSSFDISSVSVSNGMFAGCVSIPDYEAPSEFSKPWKQFIAWLTGNPDFELDPDINHAHTDKSKGGYLTAK